MAANARDDEERNELLVFSFDRCFAIPSNLTRDRRTERRGNEGSTTVEYFKRPGNKNT